MSVAVLSDKMNLVGNDGVGVEFTILEIKHFKYISNIVEGDSSAQFEVDIPSKILLILKELINLKYSYGVEFKQKPQTKTYRGFTTKVPPYDGGVDPWINTSAKDAYYTYLTKIPVEDLCQAFIISDYLDYEDAIYAIGYILIQHMLNYTADVRSILKKTAPHVTGILSKIHIANISYKNL